MVVNTSEGPYLIFKNGFAQNRKNCFLNSVVQALLAVDAIRDKLSWSIPIEEELLTLFDKQEALYKEGIDLNGLKKLLGFCRNQMHDAEECLVQMMQRFSDKVKELFQFESKTECICRKCGSSVLTEKNWKSELILAIRPKDQVNMWSDLSNFTFGQQIQCSNVECNSDGCTVAEKSFYRVPSTLKYLLVKVNLIDDKNRMLNRVIKGFSSTVNSFRLLQENNRPMVLKTKLLAVICHNGTDMTSGHYVTYRLHEKNWYLIDDQNVCYKRNCRLPSCMKNFYILLFEKV